MGELGLRQAIVMGCAQALALAPGVSRSGITITAGRFMKLNRDGAARFSFLLLIPTVLGAVLLKGVGDVLTIHLKYSPDRDRTISGLRRVSSPGLRVYRKANAVPRVLGGLGVAVLSTSQGLMTDREARKRKVGGEILCYVW